jgi:hypothetical protein
MRLSSASISLSSRVTSSAGTEKSSLRHTTNVKYELSSSRGVDSSRRMCCRPFSYSIVLRTANGSANPDDMKRCTVDVACPEAAVAAAGLAAVTA